MARECRRLLVDPGRIELEGWLSLEPAELHYLARVLRLRPGDRFELVDGCGHLWTALLQSGARARLEQPLAEPLRSQSPPAPALHLLVVAPRRDGDVLLRMACELGIDRLTLLQAERRVAPPLNGERARTIMREACEQSERLWLPDLELDRPLRQSLQLQPAPGSPALLATTRRSDAAPLSELLTEIEADASRVLRLAVGAEGGWTPAEEALAIGLGWRPVSLGPTVLRTSTAAVAAAALLAAWRR